MWKCLTMRENRASSERAGVRFECAKDLQNSTPHRPLIAAGIALSIFSGGVNAFGVAVSDTEWATWPEYCQVQYRRTPVGWNSRGHNPKHLLDKWESSLKGSSLHHFCIGWLRVNRALGTAEPKERRQWFGRAINEIDYSYRQVIQKNPKSPFFSHIHAYYALALNGVGKRDEALAMLDRGMEGQPDAPDSFVAKAQLLREDGNLDEAESVLREYLDNNKLNVAEAQYHLAYVMYEKKDYSEARRWLKMAEKNGYPLLGLRRNLEELGEWE
jgi:hypothetical protein